MYTLVYQCLLANLSGTSTEFRYDRNEIIKKKISDEKIFWVAAILWVGRKGEINDILLGLNNLANKFSNVQNDLKVFGGVNS